MPADPSLAPIAARHAGASPGPWAVELKSCHAGDWTDIVDADGRRVALLIERPTWEEHDANADFIAAAWEDVRVLLAEVGRLRADLDRAMAPSRDEAAFHARFADDDPAVEGGDVL